ncbi:MULTISPECIES: BMP family ABC transporter substrate-binding protein [unclassified Streptomyces]|uniref:BMP family ABC transporter substrate-binding protein n=1 Tax=unclassified Streptomyces TaxID=2593676 RepID=UPI001CBAB1E8|nr:MULTISPECIES: BMP family ABC transporter substrate-binding protein [unclassified Streptomyces]WPO74806.1 BMP family ABC transporter substrate-binding protein [Streptomyces sp. KN37]
MSLRTRTSPRLTAATAGVVCAALLATGCNAAAKGGDAGKGGGGKTFTLVTPDPVAQNEFLKLAVTGVRAAARAQGGSQKVFQSSDNGSRQQNVASAVDAAPDVVALVGFEFADIVAQQAEAHPKQRFLLVDACTKKTYENVTCAVFREHEAVYLAGAEAGLLTESGKVGAVDVLDTPQFRRYSEPFAAGAKKVNPKVSARTLFVGGQSPFNDAARAKDQAATLRSGGADQVMAAAAGGNTGVFQAAKDKGFAAYGVDANQCPGSPGVVVDNVLKKTDVAVEKGIAQILDGKGGTTVSYGLKEGGMSLTGLEPGVAGSKCLIAKPAHKDVLTRVEKLRDAIVAGKLTVDDPAA